MGGLHLPGTPAVCVGRRLLFSCKEMGMGKKSHQPFQAG
jgi:hypothetical protein